MIGAFFYAASDGLVFENSTACVYVETRSLAIWLRTNPVWFSFGRTDFEHKLKVTKDWSAVLANVNTIPANFLHGEFDPGSGRTLAARLIHASRARTRASALGTAANG